jgi:hypothetical protein
MVDVNEAYSFLPNAVDSPINDMRKTIAIKQFVTFNHEELDYILAQGERSTETFQDEIFGEMTTVKFDDMPTELINNQSPDNEQAKEPGYVLPKPAVKKHPGGRPKGSKGKK